MRIVEREGTGIKTAWSQSLKKLSVAVVLGAGLACQVQAAQTTVALNECGVVSVGVSVDGSLLVGRAKADSGYAVVALQALTEGDMQIFAAGEGTGIVTNAAGEGTGIVINAAGEGTGINAAGEGTGGQDSSPVTDAAGEGTGSSDQINAAGEGTGSPVAVWGWAELAFSSETTADLILYRQSQETLTEYEIFSNVAVSGLASGIGCDRE